MSKIKAKYIILDMQYKKLFNLKFFLINFKSTI